MKILQITSDWKWTGPAAPMLELLRAQRAQGCTVELACPEPPAGSTSSLIERARAVGVEPVLKLSRSRRVSGWRDRADARALAQLVRGGDFGVVHSWHTRDHVLAVRALADRRRAGRTRVARSYRSAEPISQWPWNRWLFGRGTDALLCVSPRTAERMAPMRGGRPTLGTFGAVDLARFQPAPPDPRVRRSLGLEPEHRVIAIVARIQPHRRFDLLLEAMRRLAGRDLRARLLVVGRGTHAEKTAKEPARRLGIADRVIFAGYRKADYVDVLRAADVFSFLVPGSDGTCRALLEAAACGLPAVATRRGALSEIIVDGDTGFIVDDDPHALCAAWQSLLDYPERRVAMGAAARQRAQSHFAPDHLAEQVMGLYRDA